MTRAAFLLAVSALILVSALSINSLRQFYADADIVDRSLEVIAQAERVLVRVIDIQSGQRGYIITGDEKFLEHYLTARDAVGHDMQQLHMLTVDNPDQQRRVADLLPLIVRRLALAQEFVELRKTQGFKAAQAAIAGGAGKRATDQIREAVQNLVAEERQLLAARTLKKKSGARHMQFAILSLVALVAVLLALAALRIRRDVAERKLTRAALLESEERFRDLLENANDLILSVRPDGSIIYANRAWRETLGYHEAELAGLSLQDVIHPSSMNSCMQTFQRVLSGEVVERVEAVFQSKSGHAITVEGNSNCHFVEGKPVATRSIFRDISKSKQAEKERDLLFNHALDMYCIAGFDGYFKQINPAWERTLGWSRDEMLGQPYLKFIHPDDHNASVNAARTIESGKELLQFDNRYLCKDGSYKWFSWVAFPQVEEGLIFAVARDVTESRLAQTRLAEIMALQRAILDNAGYAIISTTPEGIITTFNPAAEHMLGYTAAEMVGLQTPAILHEPNEVLARAQEFSAELHETIAPGFEVFVAKARHNLPNEHEWTYIRKDGSRFPVLLTVTALRDTAGEVSGFLGLAVDLTERKRAEQLLRAKNEELKTFAYTVSHDLKAPLRGISGYAQELERRHKEGLAQRAQFCITQIITASKNLDNLIEDLLKYSRLDTDNPTPSEVNLSELVQSILRDRNLMLTELHVEVSSDVPPLTLTIWERGLHQVLSNLIDNAIKYSRQSQPPRLSIKAIAADGRCRVSVADNGIGFDMKYHDRIFGLFNRLVRADEFEGTGVGLAIVKKLTEKLGGSIRAEAALGEGATFFVEFPVQHGNRP